MLKTADKKDALNRLKTVRGHLDSVIRMVEDDTYCVDVVKQISAMRAALDRVARIEVRNHFETCVVSAMKSGKHQRAIDDLMTALNFNKTLF